MGRHVLAWVALALSTWSFSVACAADSNSTANATELVIGVVVFPKAAPLDFVGPLQYFDLLPFQGYPSRILTIGNESGLMLSNPNGIPFYATTSYRDVIASGEKIDLLLVPGGPGRTSVINDPEFTQFIADTAEKATSVLVVCTGGAIFAETGLLDGRNATTNKQAFDAISTAYPAVNWVRKARWVVDGKFWTSSGVYAGTDMARAYISETYGEDLAARLSTILEIVANIDSTNDPFA